MKTKKTKRLSLIYVIGFVVVLSGALYLSFNALVPELWIWIGFSNITLLLFYSLNRGLKKLLLLNFQRHLQLKVQKKDWPIEMTFPMKENIELWINEYNKSVTDVLSASIWANITEGDAFQRWVQILKKVSVPVIGVSGGISLCELYYLESVHVDNADFNVDTCHKLEQTRAFLEYMPVRDLTVYVFPPIRLTPISLHYLMIRDEKIGDFNEVCMSLMKSKCEIIAPMAVIEQLISEKIAKIPIVFPQRFLAYLIKMEVENRFNLKSDPEKRKKVFDWYMSQAVQEFDFYNYWPKLTEEETRIIFKLFDEKIVRDQIFLQNQCWEYVPTNQLIPILYSKYGLPDDDFTKEIVKRL